MDNTFEALDKIRQELEGNSLFTITITGFKVFAIAFLGLKFLGTYIKSFETESPKIGSVTEVLGYGLIILSGDWVISTIETIFSGIESLIVVNQPEFNGAFAIEANAKIDEANTSVFGGLDAEILTQKLMVMIYYYIYLAIWIVDSLVYKIFLIERLFMIQLMRFLFPLMIAVSTIDGMKDMFYRWIKRYTGLLILPIPYIVIYTLANKIAGSLDVEVTEILDARVFLVLIQGLLISMLIKVKLMKDVNEIVKGLFS